MSLERHYQPRLIKRIEAMLPGCIVLKNDPGYQQGFPDLTVLYRSKWAVLEVKKGTRSRKRPNQSYFIDRLNEMSFAAFIYPENEEAVLDDLQQALRPSRKTRVSQREQVPLD